jgi:hypothetical protein
MLYRVNGPGWPVAGGLILGEIDGATNILVKGLIPPLNCTPLDEEAWLVMQANYPAHLLGPPPPPPSKTSRQHKEK